MAIKIQKNVTGVWEDYSEVYNNQITIPVNGLLKLDVGEDSEGNYAFEGFNNLDVSIGEAGEYRVYVGFLDKNSIWEEK